MGEVDGVGRVDRNGPVLQGCFYRRPTRDRTDVGKTLAFKADVQERSLETALLAGGDFY